MKHGQVTRRDLLKLFGAVGLFAPLSKIFQHVDNQELGIGNSQTPNIIILLFDTLSAGHMGLYGYGRNTTPNIDKFAKTSTVFHRNYSASNFTQPSTASLLTGVYPWSHRSLNFYTPLLKNFEKNNLFSKINSNFFTQTYTHNTFVMTILEQFEDYIDQLKPIEDLVVYDSNHLPNFFANDYPMGFYAAKRWRDNYIGPSHSLFFNPVLSVLQSLASSQIQKANNKKYPLGLVDNQESYIFKLEDAIDWIAKSTVSTAQPYLGYYHLLPPHEAYRPRADFAGMFTDDKFTLPEKEDHYFSRGETQDKLEKYRDRYDEYIAFVDSEFGRLYKLLEENKTIDNTYFILTSDHGQLFERGIHGHGVTLFDHLLHIPLIIHAPDQTQGKDVFTPTSIIDIMPTLLKLTNQDIPDWLEGKNLPLFEEPGDARRIIFSMDGRENHKMAPLKKVTFSAIQWPYKLIHYRGYPGFDDVDELFRLDNDPEELDNLAASFPSIVAELKNEILEQQRIAEIKSIGISID